MPVIENVKTKMHIMRQIREERNRRPGKLDFGECLCSLAAIGWGFFAAVFDTPQTLLLLKLQDLGASKLLYSMVQIFGGFVCFCGLWQLRAYLIGPDKARRNLSYVAAIGWGFIAATSVLTQVWYFGVYVDFLFCIGNCLIFLNFNGKMIRQGHG